MQRSRAHARARSPRLQCRDRYNNHAQEDIDDSPCRPEEVLLLIDLHKVYENRWTRIAAEMSASAAAAAEPGAKTRRTENWVKNMFNAKKRKKGKSDVMWAPLQAYVEAYEGARRDMAPEPQRVRDAQPDAAEAAEAAEAVQRRSARVIKRPRYDEYIEASENEKEEEEEAPPPAAQSLMQLMSFTPESQLLLVPSFLDDFDPGARCPRFA